MAQKYWITLPGSQWTARETEVLNVEDAVRPWRDLLRPEFRTFDMTDPVLSVLLDPIQSKAREVDAAQLIQLYSNSIPGGAMLSAFYEDVSQLVSKLEALGADLEDTTTEPPSPKHVVKRRKVDRDAKLRPDSARSDASIPRSSSLQSINSVSSDDQISLESMTERAFFQLLRYVVMVSATVRKVLPLFLVSPDHVRFNIKLSSRHPGCTVINDGCIRIRQSHNLVINIECKSREGSTGYEIYDKIFAQEYAEMLAMILDREKNMFRFRNKLDSFWVVYSFSVHHRRAYLTRTNFSPEYLEALVHGKLQDESVVVERSESSYRLDDVDGLRELITIIYSLLMQLEYDVSSGALA